MSTQVATQDEMQILARIARGDTQLQIAKDFGISKDAVTAIKKRNPDTLKVIQEQVLSHRVSHAARILGKTNRALENRLDESEAYDDKVEELRQQWADGTLDEDQYKAKLRALNKVSVSELVAISKEMHTQTKNDSENEDPLKDPGQSQEYLMALAKALESGDEVVLERLVFNPKREIISP